MPWSVSLLFSLSIFWLYQDHLFGSFSQKKSFVCFSKLFLLVNSDHLSSFGIKHYNVIRAIHDETTSNYHRRKRSIIETNPDRILTLELDHK